MAIAWFAFLPVYFYANMCGEGIGLGRRVEGSQDRGRSSLSRAG